ncbi:putative reverse transcriptase domain-containing protein [Tanacetum coccineum]|uniref:Reverse transcriptase domain-containing protein n=1 Tax=Tanacetum coccineum TaxID=301880 RepID=A0ABQ5GTP6_9ASTR
MLCTCYGHGLTKATIIQIFYHGLDNPTQGILDAGGIFLYNTPNEAFKILEDNVLLKLDILDDSQNNPKPKSVVSASGSNIDSYHGDVAAIEEDAIKPIPTMLNSSLIKYNLPFLKDCVVHIPYTNANTIADDVLLNHVGGEELNSIGGIGNGALTKKNKEKDDKGVSKEPNKEWKRNEKVNFLELIWIRRIGPPGYGVSDLLDTAYQTYWVRRIELLRIIYDVYTDVDTAYSSKSGNGLLIRQSLGYVGVDVVVRIDIPDGILMPDVVERLEQVEEGLQNIYKHVFEIPLQRIKDIKTGQRELEARSLIDGGERASLLECVGSATMTGCDLGDWRHSLRGVWVFVHDVNITITCSGMTPEAIEDLVNRRVEEALSAYEATRAANALRLKIKAKTAMTVIIEMVEMEMVEMEMVEMEMVEMEMVKWKIQMRLIGGMKGCFALTWWNSHKRTVGTEAAFAMSWRKLMKLMAEVYYLRNEIQKMESELWNLTIVPEEEDRVEKFIGGLPDNIQGNVIAAKPIRLQDAVRIANNLMDQKLKGYAVKNAVKKEGWRSTRETTMGSNHHSKDRMLEARMWQEPTRLCKKCNKVGHMARDCKNAVAVPATQRALIRTVEQWENRGLRMLGGKAYVMGGGEANHESNIVTGTFLLNNQYASMLFDSGANRSFVLTTFSTLLDITPDTLDISHAVELTDGRISKTNTVLRGCTLGLLGHSFNIDLMPVELGSFDVIIGMNWLANHHAVIACDEKIVRIPYRDEVLIVQGDSSDKGKKKKETEDKLEEKQLEDVPIVRDFLEVFPEDFPGLPQMRQVEFQFDLVPGATPMVRAPYRLASTELQELSTQLQELSDKGFIRPSSLFWGAPVLFVKKKDGSFQMCIDYRFSKIAKPMTKLTQKNAQFDWSEKAEAAFQLLKHKLCSALILALPEGSENFMVYCDASRKGLGAVLMGKETRGGGMLEPKGNKSMTLLSLSLGFDDWSEPSRASFKCPGNQTQWKKMLDDRQYLKEEVGLETWYSIGYDYGLSSADEWSDTCMIRKLLRVAPGSVAAKVGDAQLTGPKIIHETSDRFHQIKKRIQEARDRKKSYADRRCKSFEFEVEEGYVEGIAMEKGDTFRQTGEAKSSLY